MSIHRRAMLAGLLAAVAVSPTIAAPLPDNVREMYGPVPGGAFPVPAVNLSRVGHAFLRARVPYATREAAGTIVIDPPRHYLYFVNGDGTAMRYGVGVGRQGFAWKGVASINSKQEWPDWYPPMEMIERQPELKRVVTKLQSGIGMPGGPHNPLGARAMYLWQNNKDTLYRIHGTTEPWTIGTNASSGCIRMINQDAMDLFQRVNVGAKVVVLGSGGSNEIAIEPDANARAMRATQPPPPLQLQSRAAAAPAPRPQPRIIENPYPMDRTW